jgi:hypothetical protein
MLPSWQDREATRRGFLRELNEHIAEVGVGFGFERGGRLRLVCECGNDECMQAIELTLAGVRGCARPRKAFCDRPRS